MKHISLAQVVDTMAEGVFVVDASHRIVLWNRAMEALTGYTEAEVLGKGCSLLQCDGLQQGVAFKPRVKLIKLCKAEYAESVRITDRHISRMMPCTMAVWEGDDGKTYLSEMNMGLMAKLFGGNIRKIVGEKVVHEEDRILTGLLKN